MNDARPIYNPTIDTLKGFLIFLVIVGHLFLDPLVDNPWKWAIYSFHMPLFMGIGGYMVNLTSLQKGNISDIFSRYGKRMLLPWLVVFVIYTLFTFRKIDITAEVIIRIILQPPYHTWYIPVFFLYVLLSYFIKRSHASAALIAAFAVGVGGMFAFQTGNYFGPLAKEMLPDERYFTMAPFFFFGLWLRQTDLRVNERVALAIAAVAGVAYQLCFFVDVGIAQIVPYIALNIALISSLPWLFSLTINIGMLRRIGWDSLYFYLWHPFVLIVAKATLYKMMPEVVAASIALVITLAALFAGLFLLRRFSLIGLVAGMQPAAGARSVSALTTARP